MAQKVKNLPTMQEIRVRSLGQEDPQGMEMAMPKKSHGQRSLAGYSPWNSKESDATEVTWHALRQEERRKKAKSRVK